MSSSLASVTAAPSNLTVVPLSVMTVPPAFWKAAMPARTSAGRSNACPMITSTL
jgi:hypothetical protein